MQYLKRLTRRAHDRGASLVEYALLVALIAVVCIGAVTFLGGGTSGKLDEAGNRHRRRGQRTHLRLWQWVPLLQRVASRSRGRRVRCYQDGTHVFGGHPL